MLIAKENVSDMLTKSANWARKEEAGTDDTTLVSTALIVSRVGVGLYDKRERWVCIGLRGPRKGDDSTMKLVAVA